MALTDFWPKSTTQPGWPDLQYRNLIQGTFLYQTLGSGAVTATLATGGGILKGIWLDDFVNADSLVIDASGGIGSAGTWGTGALGVGFQPMWLEFKSTLTVTSGTAQLFGALIGTGLGPLTW